jgi:hypothetical protein
VATARDVRVHDQVQVATTRPGLDVAQTVPLLGERSQSLGQQREVRDPDAQLSLPGGDHLAGGTHGVSHIEILQFVESVTQLVTLGHDLDAPGTVLERGEHEVAEAPLQHHATRHGDRLTGRGARLEVAVSNRTSSLVWVRLKPTG